MPAASITTDVIVGFCGETEAEFERRYGLLEDAALRQGARRCLLAASRHHRLPQAGGRRPARGQEGAPARRRGAGGARLGRALNQRLEGTEQEVLVEGKRDGRWHGRTRSNKLVHFAGECAVGDIVEVEVADVSAWSLKGRLASMVALAP